ncbi:MAG: hypothetical protein U0931_39585 [Vulcanimicrobiota bacterium]
MVVLAGANVDEELGSKKLCQFGLSYVDATVKFDPKTKLARELDATPAEAGALERRPSQSYFFNDGKVKHKLQEYVVYR